MIQTVAARTLRRRLLGSKIMVAVCGVALLVALAPLLALVIALISKGLHWWSVAFFTKPPSIPTLTNPNDLGGISNAIIGSLVIVGLAALFAIPIGLVAGLFLAESDSRLAGMLRVIAEVMTGMPSILLGLFSFQVLVVGITLGGIKFPKTGISGLAGSFALAILMVPIIMKAAEISLRSVPIRVREAAVALGARQGVVARRVVIPTALPGLVTAVLLAIARAVGETAPILFVIGASAYNRVTFNPRHEMGALPLTIYQFAVNSLAPAQQDEVWGIALFLVVVVLVLNLGSRLVAGFIQRERR